MQPPPMNVMPQAAAAASQPPNNMRQPAMQGDFPLNGAPDQIPASNLIGGVGQHNPFFAPQPQGLGQPRIIGDPTLSGPQMHPRGGVGIGGGIGGNLVGPNAGIF